MKTANCYRAVLGAVMGAIVLFVTGGVAQDSWLPIAKDDLALKDNPLRPGSAAMVLYREFHTDDVKRWERHYVRLKIFNEEGKKYANVEIPYLEKLASIEEIRARAIRPDGTVVDFRGEVFDRPVAKSRRMKLQAKSFALPGVETGGIVEYMYRVRWRANFPDVLKNPQDYLIESTFAFPTATWSLQHELFTRRARFSIQPLPKAQLRWTPVRIGKDTHPKSQEDGLFALEVNDVAGIDEEELMPPRSMLDSRVHLYYLVGGAYSVDSFWWYQGKNLAEQVEKFIGKHKAIDRAVAQIISPADTPETKLKRIYARVQRVREVRSGAGGRSAEDAARNKDVEDVLNRGYGFGNEVNYLFIAMARAAGFEANAVELVARDNGYFEPTVFDVGQFNAAVVQVRYGDKILYLDPATEFCPYGLLPWEETDTRGILVSKEGGKIVHLPPTTSGGAGVERRAVLRLLPEGTVEGTVEVAFTGLEALERRRVAAGLDAEARRKQIEEHAKAWLPSGATVDVAAIRNWESADEPLLAELKIRLPQFASRTGRRLLLPAAVFHTTRSNPLRHTNRVHPVYFPYAYRTRDSITIELPREVQLESLPDPKSVRISSAQCKTAFTQKAQAVVAVERDFSIEGVYYRIDRYPDLRDFFQKVSDGDEEKIVLRFN